MFLSVCVCVFRQACTSMLAFVISKSHSHSVYNLQLCYAFIALFGLLRPVATCAIVSQLVVACPNVFIAVIVVVVVGQKTMKFLIKMQQDVNK